MRSRGWVAQIYKSSWAQSSWAANVLVRQPWAAKFFSFCCSVWAREPKQRKRKEKETPERSKERQLRAGSKLLQRGRERKRKDNAEWPMVNGAPLTFDHSALACPASGKGKGKGRGKEKVTLCLRCSSG